MRQYCGLTSIRCHFEWRHPPPPTFSFFTNTHTHTHLSLLPLQMTYCSGTALHMSFLGPALFLCMKGTRRWSDGASDGRGEGRKRLRGKADTFLSQIMLLPPLEEKWPFNLVLHIQDGCIFFSFLFEGDGGRRKKGIV